MPFKNFTPSQLTASEVQTYLMNQSVMVFANSAARAAALTLPTEGMVTYLQDVDELEIYNGSSWLRVVVTADDEGISTTGSVTAVSGGADGGVALRPWTNNSAYQSLATTNMTGSEYMIMSNGNNTFVSGGTGGQTAIRGGGDSSTAQVVVTTSEVIVAGNTTFDGSSLKVDATNDVVGIMTSSPSTGQYNDWSVDIASGRVRIGGNRSGGTAGISFGAGTPTASWYNGTAFIGLESNTNSARVGVWHSAAWRMLIDTAGRMVLPYQPYFNGQHSGGNVVFNGAWSPATVHINNGSRFNTGNGRFTTGVAGSYVLCSFNSLINTPQTDSHAYVWFQVDGVEKSARVHTDYNHSRSYEPLSNSAVVYLPSASSYVECQVRCVNNGSIYGSPWGGGLTFAMLG